MRDIAYTNPFQMTNKETKIYTKRNNNIVKNFVNNQPIVILFCCSQCKRIDNLFVVVIEGKKSILTNLYMEYNGWLEKRLTEIENFFLSIM